MHPEVARVKNRLGTLYIERTQFSRAEQYFQDALEARIKSFGPMHSRTAQTYKHLITCHQLQEHYSKALDCAKKALEIVERIHGPASVQACRVLVRIGEIYYLQDGYTSVEGRSALQSAHKKLVALFGKDHKEVSRRLAHLFYISHCIVAVD